MRWSLRIARIASIDIKIHVTFLLFLGWIGFAYYRQGGPTAARAGLVFVLLLFTCVLLHELGHALVARRYGIRTPNITLLPIGGVARLSRIPSNPRQELAIVVAGPAVNIVIALGLYYLLGRMTNVGDVLALQDSRTSVLANLFTVNIWLVLFNLIPAFPMDGGRILRSLLAMRMPYPRATQIAAGIGQAIAFVFGFVGLLGNPMLLFIALFVYLGATQEAAIAQMKDITERIPVSAAMVTDFRVLPANATLSDAVDLLIQTSQHEFPVVHGDGSLAGVLVRDDLITGLRQLGPDAPVAQVMRTNVPVVSTTTPFEEAFELMQESGSPVVVATADGGRLAGLVSPETVGELLLVHSALRGRQPPGGAVAVGLDGPRPVQRWRPGAGIPS